MTPSPIQGQAGDTLREWVDDMAQLMDQAFTPENQPGLLGPVLTNVTLPAGKLPRKAAIWLALASDCLRVSKLAIEADGVVSPDEVEYVFPLVFQLARLLDRIRPSYHPFCDLTHQMVASFLKHWEQDREPFGFGCEETHWIGLDLCRRVTLERHDAEAFQRYERQLLHLMDEIIALDGITAEEIAERDRLHDLLSLQCRLEASEEIRAEEGGDARVEAFCNPNGPTVFYAISHAHQIWERDPFDVESVHREAREVFERLVERVATPGKEERGRILLVLGESGSGKTHLMRAFRNYVHERRLGYVGYMQMSSRTEDYSRYALINLLDSLERPYDAPEVDDSGIMRLSDALAEFPGALSAGDLENLREGSLERPGQDIVSPYVDKLLMKPQLSDFDPDILRAILFLQRREPPIKARVLKYLRCEHLTAWDRQMIGDIAPLTSEAAPQRMLEQLGRLISAIDNNTLVLLVDQLEDIFHLDEVKDRFLRAVDVLRHAIENVPSSIVVIACLEDMYSEVRTHLSRAALDRIEKDPDKLSLTSRRSLEENEQIVARRLEHLYQGLSVRFRENDPIYPFRRADLEKLTNFRTRDVLDWCRMYQEACIDAGDLVHELPWAPLGSAPPSAPPTVPLEQAWNDFRTQAKLAVPEEDHGLLDIIEQSIRCCGAEFRDRTEFVCERQNHAVLVKLPTAAGKTDKLFVGICNNTAIGGSLSKQLQELEANARPHIPAAIRASEFPRNPRTMIARQLGGFISRGGRRVVVEDSDLRTMLAYARFRETHGKKANFGSWLLAEKPLTQLRAIRELLAIDELREARTATPVPAQTATTKVKTTGSATPPSTPASGARTVEPSSPGSRAVKPPSPPKPPRVTEEPDRVLIGGIAGVRPAPVFLEVKDLTMHTAIFGMTGSGKTTLALNILEQILARGIPALIIDRKGDLSTYGKPNWFQRGGLAAAAQARAERLAAKLDVRVFTPGEPRGNPLSLPVVPSGLGDLASHERDKVARQAAYALGKMMGYRDGASDRARMVILAKAIELLGTTSGKPEISLEDIVDVIATSDPALVNAIGRLDTKHFAGLVNHLETLRHGRGTLLGGNGVSLDLDDIFGATAGPKTRLSIISTKSLGDNATIEFWIARLLVEIGRWANRHPSRALRALLFLDEADLYMPAVSKPATKEPLQDLLRRGRSAGLGLLLASQNPGDFDYKSRDNIRTWFVGTIKDSRSRDKMRALLAECRVNVAARLAALGTGEFFELTGQAVVELKADRSIVETAQLGEHEIVEIAAANRNQPVE